MGYNGSVSPSQLRVDLTNRVDWISEERLCETHPVTNVRMESMHIAVFILYHVPSSSTPEGTSLAVYSEILTPAISVRSFFSSPSPGVLSYIS